MNTCMSRNLQFRRASWPSQKCVRQHDDFSKRTKTPSSESDFLLSTRNEQAFFTRCLYIAVIHERFVGFQNVDIFVFWFPFETETFDHLFVDRQWIQWNLFIFLVKLIGPNSWLLSFVEEVCRVGCMIAQVQRCIDWTYLAFDRSRIQEVLG